MQHPDPIRALLDTDGPAALAIICDLTGPFYRPLGAMMAVLADGTCVGSLSSGCVEADIALNAQDALTTGHPRTVRYGVGSPAMDLQLPCGGGMAVIILPNPDSAVLGELQDKRDARIACALWVNTDSCALALAVSTGAPVRLGRDHLCVAFPPALRIVTFGDGPEAACFTSLCGAAGYDHLLVTGDRSLYRRVKDTGSAVNDFDGKGLPPDLKIDAQTAIVLFFHNHDVEPPILAKALRSPAFYIGAQGSLLAQDRRRQALIEMGVKPDALARLVGPIGLIPSARDPQTLAISVLADVVARAGRAAL